MTLDTTVAILDRLRSAVVLPELVLIAMLLGAGVPPAVAASAATDAIVEVPRTGVRMPLLPGMALVEGTNSFVDDATRATLQVSEMTAPYGLLAAELAPEYLRVDGIEIESTEETRIGGYPATIVSGRQEVDGRTLEKWIAVFGTPRKSVSVLLHYPQSLAPKLRERAHAAIKAIAWSPDSAVDMSGARFSLRQTERLKINNRVGDIVTLSTAGGGSMASFDEPLVVVRLINAPEALPQDDLEGYARRAITREGLLQQSMNHRQRVIEIDGRTAVEIIADAQLGQSGEDMSVYQLMLVGGARRILLMQAFMARDGFDAWVDEFRQLGESLRLR